MNNDLTTDIFDIERCPLDYYCTKKWDELQVSNSPKVRFCSKCSHEVYLCETVAEFDKKSAEGACVALRIRKKGNGVIEMPLGLPVRKK